MKGTRFSGLVLLLLGMMGCSAHKDIPVQIPEAVSALERSYLDLEPGRTLRVVVPLLTSGGFLPKFSREQTGGNTITFSSKDVIGYTTFHYTISGKKDGRVRLELASTEESKDGKTVPNAGVRALPFALPQGTEHIRLLYMIRYSESDHGTAILGATRLEALNAFTNRVIERPSLCNESGDVFCSWVPAGVGVQTD
jgi:hypothetical protein